MLSSTVLQVIERFMEAMRSDSVISDDTITRLNELLLQGIVPKPDDINEAVFDNPQDGQE
ncbi:hypothetical protein ACFL6M_06565 [Candidatus Eisenbacteria bacterium]|uniref:Uncharacterized protein n=1 Tax=Eiseniibacteriota bacterium TaxID=2212470 RepID=A0ABV6YLN3_UNCEI